MIFLLTFTKTKMSRLTLSDLYTST